MEWRCVVYRVVPESHSSRIEQPKLSAIVPDDRGKNDKFKRNLLSKRRTYTKYFERSLSTIDDKLRKIVLARDIKARLWDEQVERRERVSSAYCGVYCSEEHKHVRISARAKKLRALGPLPEVNPREKERLDKLTKKSKKYILRTVEKDRKRLTIIKRRGFQLSLEEERRLAVEKEKERVASEARGGAMVGFVREGFSDLSIQHPPSMTQRPPDPDQRPYWERDAERIALSNLEPDPIPEARARKAPLRRSNAIRGKGRRVAMPSRKK
jgi:hypothetical protein